jgi:hypothetical protein
VHDLEGKIISGRQRHRDAAEGDRLLVALAIGEERNTRSVVIGATSGFSPNLPR